MFGKIAMKFGSIGCLVLLLFALTACGGGGGSSGSGESPKPTEVEVVIGQPGAEDRDNYFPFTTGDTWTFEGTSVLPGQPPEAFSNVVTITGTTPVQGVNASVFNESNPLNDGLAEETLLFEDANGVVSFGNTDATDNFTPQLVPNWVVRFPLTAGSAFQQLLRSGLDFDDDVDGDGLNETANVDARVTVVGFETVVVPAGTFNNCARIETRTTLTVIQSSDGLQVPLIQTLTIWYAPAVGWVKRVTVIEAPDLGFSQTFTENLSSFSVQ